MQRSTGCGVYAREPDHIPFMKNQTRFATFFLTLALAAVPMLRAQPAEDQKAPRGPGGPGGRGPNLEMLAHELGLTVEQKAKLEPIMKEQGRKMQELRQNEALSREEKMEKGRALRTEGQKEIEAVLTPEQVTKLAELRARAPRGERPKGEKPAENK
jgi:Spy/CpxP family protein refolding chaperone